jgi:hypothetical protein
MNAPHTESLDDYYAALRRLVAGRPLRVPPGTKITNDAVSVEAGRRKGSIKKSRVIYSDLILAIRSAASNADAATIDGKEQIQKYKEMLLHYKQSYEAALSRELSLLKELYETKKKLAKLTGEKVIPLRNRDSKK